MHGHDAWHMNGMWLWWLLIIVAAVVLVALAAAHRWRRTGRAEAPEQTLKRRFARGEIDRETYDRMLSELRK